MLAVMTLSLVGLFACADGGLGPIAPDGPDFKRGGIKGPGGGGTAQMTIAGAVATTGPIAMKTNETSKEFSAQNGTFSPAITLGFDVSDANCGVFPASSSELHRVVDGLKNLLSGQRGPVTGWVSLHMNKKRVQPNGGPVENGGDLLLLNLDDGGDPDNWQVTFAPDKFGETPTYTVNWQRADDIDTITYNGTVIAFDQEAPSAEPGKRARVFCQGIVTVELDSSA